jgi:hypothetical protein
MSVGSEERPLLVAAETLADYAAALACCIAGDRRCEWAPIACSGTAPAGSVPLHGEVAAGHLFNLETWSVYERLWYRWLAPRDFVPPTSWLFAAIAGRSGGGAEHISASVDRWLQELSARPLAERGAGLRGLADCDQDAAPVLACGDPKDAIAIVAFAALRARPFLEAASPSELQEFAAASPGSVAIWAPDRILDSCPELEPGSFERLRGDSLAELSLLAARLPIDAPRAAGGER